MHRHLHGEFLKRHNGKRKAEKEINRPKNTNKKTHLEHFSGGAGGPVSYFWGGTGVSVQLQFINPPNLPQSWYMYLQCTLDYGSVPD